MGKLLYIKSENIYQMHNIYQERGFNFTGMNAMLDPERAGWPEVEEVE